MNTVFYGGKKTREKKTHIHTHAKANRKQAIKGNKRAERINIVTETNFHLIKIKSAIKNRIQ